MIQHVYFVVYVLDSETLVHMLLVCEKLEDVRKPISEELMFTISEHLELDSDMFLESQLQVILDIYQLLLRHTDGSCVMNNEYNSRRLCYNLHCKRYELLCKLPTRKRYGLCTFSLVNSAYLCESDVHTPVSF